MPAEKPIVTGLEASVEVKDCPSRGLTIEFPFPNKGGIYVHVEAFRVAQQWIERVARRQNAGKTLPLPIAGYLDITPSRLSFQSFAGFRTGQRMSGRMGQRSEHPIRDDERGRNQPSPANIEEQTTEDDIKRTRSRPAEELDEEHCLPVSEKPLPIEHPAGGGEESGK